MYNAHVFEVTYTHFPLVFYHQSNNIHLHLSLFDSEIWWITLMGNAGERGNYYLWYQYHYPFPCRNSDYRMFDQIMRKKIYFQYAIKKWVVLLVNLFLEKVPGTISGVHFSSIFLIKMYILRSKYFFLNQNIFKDKKS